jgi:hypothetical protein
MRDIVDDIKLTEIYTWYETLGTCVQHNQYIKSVMTSLGLDHLVLLVRVSMVIDFHIMKGISCLL